MARFTSTKVSDTCYRLSTGRDTVGWIRKAGDAWVVSSTKGTGRGATAREAFEDFMRGRNNAVAKSAGFASAREMVQAQNAQVVKEADEFNALMRDALGGLAPLVQVQVRKGRRIIT